MKTKTLFKNCFLWLSNTDPVLYQQCPSNVKWKRQGLSMIVLITGIFAFLTASFFIRTTFQFYDETAKSFVVSGGAKLLSVFIGIIWAAVIMLIDREIVSASTRIKSLLRIPLAIMIGLVLSLPLEVQLFSTRINKELLKASHVENITAESKYNKSVEKINNEIDTLKTTISSEKSEMSYWKSIMEAEAVGRVKQGCTGITGTGPAYDEAKENFSLHKTFLADAQTQLNLLLNDADSMKSLAKSEYKEHYIEQTYDFVTQYEELKILKKENKNISSLANIITLLFILIELVPALLRIFNNDNDEYDNLLKSRMYLNEQLINTETNRGINEIQAHPGSISPNIFLPQMWSQIK